MRWETTKPPMMFTAETKTASRARNWAEKDDLMRCASFSGAEQCF